MRRGLAGVTLALAGVLWAAPALGDTTVTAGPVPNTYASKDATIDQGGTLTFQNSDNTAFHDVRSDQNVEDKPLFTSDTIEGGKTSPVKGVEFLTTGDYPFHCSVHPFMVGTLHVTANGTPKPRDPGNPAPNSADTTPPDASVTILDSRISAVLQHKGVRVRAKTSEPARFTLTVTSGKTKVAGGIVVVKGTKRDATLALTKSGRKLLAHASKVNVRLSAKVNDAANNKAAASASRTLR